MTFFYQLTTTNFLANYQLTVNPIRTLKDNPNKKKSSQEGYSEGEQNHLYAI